MLQRDCGQLISPYSGEICIASDTSQSHLKPGTHPSATQWCHTASCFDRLMCRTRWTYSFKDKSCASVSGSFHGIPFVICAPGIRPVRTQVYTVPIRTPTAAAAPSTEYAPSGHRGGCGGGSPAQCGALPARGSHSRPRSRGGSAKRPGPLRGPGTWPARGQPRPSPRPRATQGTPTGGQPSVGRRTHGCRQHRDPGRGPSDTARPALRMWGSRPGTGGRQAPPTCPV
jgi:hypothetical protein